MAVGACPDPSQDGSHARAIEALEFGAVDAIATRGHATPARVVGPRLATPTRLLLASGPIPSDVVVVSDRLSERTRDALASGLLGLSDADRASLIPLVHARSFARVTSDHLAPLRALSARAAERAFSPLALWRRSA